MILHGWLSLLCISICALFQRAFNKRAQAGRNKGTIVSVNGGAFGTDSMARAVQGCAGTIQKAPVFGLAPRFIDDFLVSLFLFHAHDPPMNEVSSSGRFAGVRACQTAFQ
jgi:hypothetical protein